MSKNLYTGFVTTMVMVLGGTMMYGSEVLAQSSSDTNTNRPDVIINGGNNTGTGTNTTSPTQTGTDTNTTPSSNTGTNTTPSTNTETGDKRFTCELNNGKYTVMYNPQGQNKAYPWATPGDMGDTWNAQKRCETISERLELYRPDGLLELQTSTVKGYDTVCVTTEKDSSCRIVFTVPKGQNAIEIRDRVFQNLTTADGGKVTEGVATYTNRHNDGNIINQALGDLGLSKNKVNNNRAGINLKPFLSIGDGGSGAKLTSGVSINKPTSVKPVPKPVKSKRLNPNLLR